MNEITGSSTDFEVYDGLLKKLKTTVIPENELLHHLGLFLPRQVVSRFLFMNEIYKEIINVHGVIMEFGVRWGRDLVWFLELRGIYEPFNYNRKVIGFDTFEGFPSISKFDKHHKVGEMNVTEGFERDLEEILLLHQKNNPISHIKSFELIKGDATKTLKQYLEKHPETIVALAYFDLDLYEPTKVCLDLLKKHFVKGSVIAFDELNHPDFPGETVALREIFGLNSIPLKRFPFSPTQSYFVYGEGA